jgi:hypothetical protein
VAFSALPLLVAGISANDAHDAISPNDFTVATYFFH